VQADGTVKGWMEHDGEKVRMHFTVASDGVLRFGPKTEQMDAGCELEHSCITWAHKHDELRRRPRAIKTAVHKTSHALNNGTVVQVVNMFELLTLHLRFHIHDADGHPGEPMPTVAHGSIGGQEEKVPDEDFLNMLDPGTEQGDAAPAVNDADMVDADGCEKVHRRAAQAGGGMHYLRWDGIKFPSHNLKPGDALAYEVLWDGAALQDGRGGIAVDLLNSENGTLGETHAVDQHGACAHAKARLGVNVKDRWMSRVIPLPKEWLTTTLEAVLFSCEFDGPGGAHGAVRNIRIQDQDANLKVRVLAHRWVTD